MKIRFLVFPILFFVGVCGSPVVFAQPAGQRWEIAAQSAMLRLSDFDATSAGIGGRISFDVVRWASVEGETRFFPSDDIALPASVVADVRVANHRRRVDVFGGLKLGVRGNRFGVFAKARPGLTRLIDRGQECLGADCARVLMLLARPEYRTEFAVDYGGVLEFYPTSRSVARFELGDTTIRHRSVAPPCPAAACTSHNVSTGVGVGFRF